MVLFSSPAPRKQHLTQPQSCQLSGLSRKGGESPLTLPSATDHQWKLPSAAWGCSCHGQTPKHVPSPALTFSCLCLCHSQPLWKSWSTAVVTKGCCQACRQAPDCCPSTLLKYEIGWAPSTFTFRRGKYSNQSKPHVTQKSGQTKPCLSIYIEASCSYHSFRSSQY